MFCLLLCRWPNSPMFMWIWWVPCQSLRPGIGTSLLLWTTLQDGQAWLPPYYCGPHFKMAGGNPAAGNYSRSLHQQVPLHMGGEVWGAASCHNGSRHTIYGGCVALYVFSAGHHTHHHTCVPPSKQWSSGALSLAAQGWFADTWSGHCLG